MGQERLEKRAREAESEVEAVLSATTRPDDATDVLTRLHSAFDVRRRYREKLALARQASEPHAGA